MNLSNKAVLVTGASGFIGGHLVGFLLQEGWHVTAALRDETAAKKLQGALSEVNFSKIRLVFVGNIDGATSWKEAVWETNAVIHAAARVHRPEEIQANHKDEYFKINRDATENLARQAMNSGVEHFIFLSSVLAVCSQSGEPLTETTPCAPDTVYGQSKLAAEKALISVAQEAKMAWTVLRLPLVYGPGNSANMRRLIRLVRSGLPLPLKGVRNRRSFLYIGNLCDAILRCLSEPHARNQIFFLSDGQDHSVSSLAAEIGSCLGKHSPQFTLPAFFFKLAGRTGGKLFGSLFVDDSLFRSRLGWTPPYSAHEGIVQTVNS